MYWKTISVRDGPETYHITILRDFLMKYRPFKCNTNHKFKNINHLSKMVNYRPMVDNIDPLAALYFHYCFQILYLKYCISNTVNQKVFLKYYISNTIIHLLYFKYYIWNTVFQTLYFKYCIWNTVFQRNNEQKLGVGKVVPTSLNQLSKYFPANLGVYCS